MSTKQKSPQPVYAIAAITIHLLATSRTAKKPRWTMAKVEAPLGQNVTDLDKRIAYLEQARVGIAKTIESCKARQKEEREQEEIGKVKPKLPPHLVKAWLSGDL
jgi:hypothetical protein